MFVACDESGKEPSAKYLVIGSIWLEKSAVSNFERQITELRISEKCWGEVEWLKLSDSASGDILKFYKDFISNAFQDIKIYFRFIIVEKALLDKKQYHENQRSNELVQLKFMYLSISRYANRFLDARSKEGLHIIFDNFEESNRSKEEKWRLGAKKYIEKFVGCKIEHFQPCNSHISSLVQLCDLITGAVSTTWNNSPSKISENKKELIRHIEQLTGKKLGVMTLPSERDFNVWVWKPVQSV